MSLFTVVHLYMVCGGDWDSAWVNRPNTKLLNRILLFSTVKQRFICL